MFAKTAVAVTSPSGLVVANELVAGPVSDATTNQANHDL